MSVLAVPFRKKRGDQHTLPVPAVFQLSLAQKIILMPSGIFWNEWHILLPFGSPFFLGWLWILWLGYFFYIHVYSGVCGKLCLIICCLFVLVESQYTISTVFLLEKKKTSRFSITCLQREDKWRRMKKVEDWESRCLGSNFKPVSSAKKTGLLS